MRYTAFFVQETNPNQPCSDAANLQAIEETRGNCGGYFVFACFRSHTGYTEVERETERLLKIML
jgi:hypothetical protein